MPESCPNPLLLLQSNQFAEAFDIVRKLLGATPDQSTKTKMASTLDTDTYHPLENLVMEEKDTAFHCFLVPNRSAVEDSKTH